MNRSRSGLFPAAVSVINTAMIQVMTKIILDFFLHSLRKLIIFVVKPKRFVSYVPSELN